MKIKLNEIELYYEKRGSGKPLIFLHGNQEDLSTFYALAKVLDDQFTCYLVDSRNHGKSMKNLPFSYEVMADDVYRFTLQLNIEKPSVLGFSDGAILGMMLAIKHPDLLDKLILAGGNLTPNGLKVKYQKIMEQDFKKTESPYLELMMKEPHLTKKDLSKISCPTLILAGQNDAIKKSETLAIHHGIKQSELLIIPNHNHESYIFGTDFLKDIITQFLT